VALSLAAARTRSRLPAACTPPRSGAAAASPAARTSVHTHGALRQRASRCVAPSDCAHVRRGAAQEWRAIAALRPRAGGVHAPRPSGMCGAAAGRRQPAGREARSAAAPEEPLPWRLLWPATLAAAAAGAAWVAARGAMAHAGAPPRRRTRAAGPERSEGKARDDGNWLQASPSRSAAAHQFRGAPLALCAHARVCTSTAQQQQQQRTLRTRSSSAHIHRVTTTQPTFAHATSIMRAYLHYDDRFTWIYAGEGREAVADVARAFARAHAGRYPAAGLPSATLELRLGDGGQALPRAASLASCVPDGGDVTVVRTAKAAEPAEAAEAPARAAARTPSAASPQQAASAAASAAALPAAALEPLLQRAVVLRDAKQLRDANEIYEQARVAPCVCKSAQAYTPPDVCVSCVALVLSCRQVLQAVGDKSPVARECFLGLARRAHARPPVAPGFAVRTHHDARVPNNHVHSAATRPPSSATTAPPRCCVAAWTRSPRTCACWHAWERHSGTHAHTPCIHVFRCAPFSRR
jgi:hypothetical protein